MRIEESPRHAVAEANFEFVIARPRPPTREAPRLTTLRTSSALPRTKTRSLTAPVATSGRSDEQKRPVRFFQTGRFERKAFPNYGPAPAGGRIKFDALSQASAGACPVS